MKAYYSKEKIISFLSLILGVLGPIFGLVFILLGLLLRFHFLCYFGAVFLTASIVCWVKEARLMMGKNKKQNTQSTLKAAPQRKFDPESEYLRGRHYFETKNEKEGLYWLEHAAQHGHQEAYKYLYNRNKISRLSGQFFDNLRLQKIKDQNRQLAENIALKLSEADSKQKTIPEFSSRNTAHFYHNPVSKIPRSLHNVTAHK